MCSLLIQGDRCDCWFSPVDGDKALRNGTRVGGFYSVPVC